MKKVVFLLFIIMFVASSEAFASQVKKQSSSAVSLSNQSLTTQQNLPASIASIQPKKTSFLKWNATAALDYLNTSRGYDFVSKGIDKPYVSLVGLSLDARFNPWVNGRFSLVRIGAPDNATPVFSTRIDEAYFTIGNFEKSPFYLSAGYYYLPFGVYKIYSISSTLTKDLSEIQRPAVGVGFEKKHWYGSIYTFAPSKNLNPDSNNTVPRLDNLGAELGYTQSTKKTGYHFYAGFLSNLNETVYINGLKPLNLGSMPALAFHAEYFYQKWGATFNITQALKSYSRQGITFNNKGAQLSVWDVKLYRHFRLFSLMSTFAIGYQRSNQALGILMPRWRYSLSDTLTLHKGITVELQFLHNKDYGKNAQGAYTSRSEGLQSVTGTGRTMNALMLRLNIALGGEFS